MSLKVENPSVKTAEDDQISPVQNGRGRGGSRGGSRGRGGRGRGGHGHGGQHGDSDQTPSYGGYGGQSRGGASKMERDDERINHQLQMMQGPTIDLPPRDRTEEKKFGGRNRLYIGGLTSDVSEEEIKELFGKYGEFSEMFLNKEKFFGFIRFDYRANAERAKLELDGQMRKGKSLRIRLAPHQAAIKVKNLSSYVTNELLEKAFSVFGEIERAVVFVNERGFSTGEGIVEFVKKPSAQAAVRKCNEGCFFLTSSLRPVVVEELSVVDDEEGYGEKNIPKKTQDYVKEREVGPRFAYPGSFEYEYGLRWKQLLELYKQKTEAMEREMKLEEEKLISQMELAKYEHETEMLREQLRQREMEQDRTKRQWEMRERQYLDARRVEEEIVGRKQEDLQSKMRKQEEDLRRRQQDNSMFLQQQQFATQGGFSQGVFPKAELDATAPIPGFDVEQPPRTGTAGPMLDDNSVRLNTENGVADIQLPDLLNMRFPAILDGKFFNVLEHDPHSGHVLATCQNCPNKLIKGSSKATTNFHKHLKAREIKSEIRQDEDMDEKKYLYVDVSRVNSVYPEDESGYQLDMPTDGSVDVKMENISSSVTEHNTLGLPENHHLELPHLDIIERTTSSNSYASYIEEERRDGTLSYNEESVSFDAGHQVSEGSTVISEVRLSFELSDMTLTSCKLLACFSGHGSTFSLTCLKRQDEWYFLLKDLVNAVANECRFKDNGEKIASIGKKLDASAKARFLNPFERQPFKCSYVKLSELPSVALSLLISSGKQSEYPVRLINLTKFLHETRWMSLFVTDDELAKMAAARPKKGECQNSTRTKRLKKSIQSSTM
ncbi:hrp65 protein-like isoform X5 [Artemia franciscana]|uniref:hrp65 protein-like isoform X5 n=1 Tax=Artemia franciscana TaxID=6661 RepID=UPI0032DAC77B